MTHFSSSFELDFPIQVQVSGSIAFVAQHGFRMVRLNRTTFFLASQWITRNIRKL